jgi:hypothetical protein
MTNILRKTAMASALAIAAIAFSGVSMAQTQKCIGDSCPQGQDQGQGMKNGNSQAMPENNGEAMPTKKLRKNGTQPNNQVQDTQNGEDQGGNGEMKKLRKKGTSTGQYQQNNDQGSTSTRQANWRFDSNRHERRRHRDTTFRFYFGGYWYPQPYWQQDYVVGGYGISCRQGRNIVAERFDRVRVVECQGRAYTYLGRRHGGEFQIVLNSRSGRIIDVNEL